ncbi:hypothetical protein F8388_015611 [Cannabis sativa]|uniref:Uncharacterized protein n=1 Tax=Cannabis sativa TaxID=3483 RepID=A0A7J6HI41_CANSA|nr:hypothetical protein F8388_015611 [Cannabis sativa]
MTNLSTIETVLKSSKKTKETKEKERDLRETVTDLEKTLKKSVVLAKDLDTQDELTEELATIHSLIPGKVQEHAAVLRAEVATVCDLLMTEVECLRGLNKELQDKNEEIERRHRDELEAFTAWLDKSSGGATAAQKGKSKVPFDKANVKCFICDGPHWAWECPKKKALTAMIAANEVVLENEKK